MDDDPITLTEFAKRVLRPSVLQAIKNGTVDNALCDPDVLEIISKDEELSMAAIERIKSWKDQQ